MNKVKEIFGNNRKRIILASFLLICLIGILLFSLIDNKYNAQVVSEEETIISLPDNLQEENQVIDEAEEVLTIKVDVKGAVNNPGVYELAIDSRVVDAISLAGGLKEDAFTRYLNLSKRLKDEYVILVNTISEVEEMKTKNSIITKEKPVCEIITNACTEKSTTITNDEEVKTENESLLEENVQEETMSLININTATVDELMMLEGIGEAKAKAIIDYRLLNGSFEKIEDIKNVSGIGEKAYEKIKESITVE